MGTKASAAKRSPGPRARPDTPAAKVTLPAAKVTLRDLRRAFEELAQPERAASSEWFFRTGPGEYGEGDRFLGLTVPLQRRLAKRFAALPLSTLSSLLPSAYHEHRLTALMILVDQYRRVDDATKKTVFDFYVKHRHRVNNWDLVDSSAPYIAGEHLLARSRRILYQWAGSDSLWDRRIAIVSTAAFIRRNDLSDTFALAERLLPDKHALIHKAVGWMLREAGKRDEAALRRFLMDHYPALPRTVLRYAIERWPQPLRQAALTGQF